MNTKQELSMTFSNASLAEAYEKLQNLKARRRDFVVPVQNLKMSDSGAVLIEGIKGADEQILNIPGISFAPEWVTINPNKVAHNQIAGRFKIPTKYWNRMVEENPALAAQNFNGWVSHEVKTKGEEKSRRMLVRTFMNEPGGNTGVFRALLSDRYLVYDNIDVLTVALKAVQKANERNDVNITVDKCDLTDKNLYVRFVNRDIEQQAPDALRNFRDPHNGDNGGLGISNGIVSGFILTNSEVGAGSLSIAPRAIVLACRNGMIWKDEKYRRTHLGAKMSEGEADWQLDTKAANVMLIEKQVRDIINRYVSPEYLGERVKDIEEMAARKLAHPVECINNMASALNFTDDERHGIFDQFIRQNDSNNVFGVAQAITSFAHLTRTERRYELESAATGLMTIVDKCDKAPALN